MTQTHHHHGHKYSVTLGYIVHVLGFIIASTGIIYSLLYVSKDGESLLYYMGWPGKLKYLTFWCQATLPLYFLFCIINDIIGHNTTDQQHFVNRSTLQTVRDNVHAVWSFPIGIFVVSSFWVLYAINRELVFPKELDKIIPVWHNHIAHTAPLVLLLLEKIFVNITYPKKNYGLFGTFFFAAVYITWIFWIAHTQDIWTYPILKVLDTNWRLVFVGACFLYMGVIYLLGHWLSKELWWGPAHAARKKKVK